MTIGVDAAMGVKSGKKRPEGSSGVETERKKYGEQVRRARQARGLSLEALVEAMGRCGTVTSKGTLSNIENGKRWPGGPMSRLLSIILRIPVRPVCEVGTGYSTAELEQLYHQYHRKAASN